MVMPQAQVFDVNQPTQNYLGARRQARAERRQDTSDANVLADRETRLGREEEDRAYAQTVRNLETDESMKKSVMDAYSRVDPDASDEIFSQQVMAIPDAVGGRLIEAGVPPERVNKTIEEMFMGGGLSKDAVRAFQEKIGVRAPSPKTSTTYNDLKAILKRDPTAKELRDYKRSSGKTGSAPSEQQMMEYLMSPGKNGVIVAKDKKEAFKMVRAAKSNPRKLATTIFKTYVDAQTAADIRPGDEGYKDRKTLIAEAKQTVIDLSSESVAAPETTVDTGAALPSPGLEEMITAPTGAAEAAEEPAATQAVAAAPAGSEPATPQTDADFARLPTGTPFIDPDDGQLYIK